MELDRYSECSAERHGKVDGRGWRWTILPWFIYRFDPIPDPSAKTPPPLVVGLLRAAQADCEAVRGHWAEQDGNYQAEAASLVERLKKHRASGQSGTAVEVLERYVTVREAREKAYEVARAKADEVAEKYAHLCEVYRRGNRRGRAKGGANVIDEWSPPPVAVPEELGALVPLRKAIGFKRDDYEELGIPIGGDGEEPEEGP